MGRPKGSKNKPEESANDDGIEIHTDSQMSQWILEGIACKYARFKDIPVAPAQGKEPVWEFKLDPKTKYSVDSMVIHHEGGLIFTAHGESCVVALGNIGYWRPL